MKKAFTAPDKITHLYNCNKILETVIHFDLDPSTPKSILTDKIKLSKDRAYSNASGQEYWLHLRELTRWGRQLTGLRPIGDCLFYGDIKIEDRKSLLIFQFRGDKSQVVIDVFRGFYPAHKGILQNIVEQHPIYYK